MTMFAWNTKSLEHLARHGVTRNESETVVRNAKPPYPLAIDGDKLLVWGKTSAGRWLQVIFVFVDDAQIEF